MSKVNPTIIALISCAMLFAPADSANGQTTPLLNNKYFIDGVTNKNPQSIYAQPSYAGGTIDWLPQNGSTVLFPQTAQGVFIDPFNNTTSIPAPIVQILPATGSNCSGVTTLIASEVLSVVQVEWDASDNLIWSGTTTIPVGTGTNCYTVLDPPAIAGGVIAWTGAEECASACSPFVPTVQLTAGGSITVSPGAGQVHTYNYTTSANSPIGTCPIQPPSSPNSNQSCFQPGQLFPQPDIGLLVPSTTINLGDATFSGCCIMLPGTGSHLNLTRRKSSVIQRNVGAPNAIPYFVLWGQNTYNVTANAGHVVTVKAAMIERAGPNAGNVISLSPGLTSGPFFGNYNQFTVNVPGPPWLYNPWVGGVYWYPNERLLVPQTAGTNAGGATIYTVNTPGLSQGPTGTTAIPSALQTLFNGCVSSCTVNDNTVVWQAQFQIPVWQSGHPYSTLGQEIFDGTNVEMVVATGVSGGTPSWPTTTVNAKIGALTSDGGGGGVTWQEIGQNSIIEPSLRWYTALGSYSPATKEISGLLSNGSDVVQFSGCSAGATDWNGTNNNCTHALTQSFTATGSGSGIPSNITATIVDSLGCPSGFSCNVASGTYFAKYVFTTPTGHSPAYNENAGVPIASNDAITFSAPSSATYAPNSSGWLATLSTVAGNEVLQPPDGMNAYCGSGRSQDYVTNLNHGVACALGASETITSVQILQPNPLSLGASDVLVTIGGESALQNQTANGQYNVQMTGGTIECGQAVNEGQPYSVGILNLLAEEESLPLFVTVNDCLGEGIYWASPGAQNSLAVFDDHIAGANYDYSFGVVAENVGALREINNLSVGPQQGTQWYDVAGVRFMQTPLSNLGASATVIRNIAGEATNDIVQCFNVHCKVEHIEGTATARRVATNNVHFDAWRIDPQAEALQVKGTACGIQDDAESPSCLDSASSTETEYVASDLSGLPNGAATLNPAQTTLYSSNIGVGWRIGAIGQGSSGQAYSSGLAAPPVLTLNGLKGGAATVGQPLGSVGGGVSFNLGDGSGGAAGNNGGGAGGTFSLVSGHGGGATGTGAAGAGGDVTFQTQNGGNSASGTGGRGGNLSFTLGQGGTGGSGAGSSGQFQITSTQTFTSNVPTLSVNSTWSGTAAVDAALLINASGSDSADSLLIDSQFGGMSKWQVDKVGNVTQTGLLTDAGTTSAGANTNALSSANVLTNANSANSNTSAGVIVGATGSSTGGIGELVFDTSGTGDIVEWYKGGSVSGGTYAPGTLEAHLDYSGNFDANGYVNATSGYQVGGSALTGNYLRGNGTYFVSNTIQSVDVPTLNQNTTGNAATATALAATPAGCANGEFATGITASGNANCTSAFNWFSNPAGGVTGNGFSLGANNTAYFGLLTISQSTTFSNIIYDVQTFDITGGDKYDLWLASCPSSDCSQPGVTVTVVCDTGAIALNSTGPQKTQCTQSVPITIKPGVYILAVCGNAMVAKYADTNVSVALPFSATSVASVCTAGAAGNFSTPTAGSIFGVAGSIAFALH